MEFLLQLMAELFGTEPEQQKLVTVAETSNNEIINAEIINPFQIDDYETDPDFQFEEGLIFDFIRFH
jgi:hypothetical protein